MLKIIITGLVVFSAYFVKGFTGFGPAIVMIPFFTILYDPGTAIITATLYDFIAGSILLYSVRRQIVWSFVFSIFAALALGAIFGSMLLGTLSTFWLKRIIGSAILIFSTLILLQTNDKNTISEPGNKIKLLRYPVSFLGGFTGGFIGITGPPIIIYMKLLYDKTFFRTQLIGIFFFGAGWRMILYHVNNISMNLQWWYIFIFLLMMLAGTWVGSHLHIRVNEKLFNRIVALILYVPALNLILS